MWWLPFHLVSGLCFTYVVSQTILVVAVYQEVTPPVLVRDAVLWWMSLDCMFHNFYLLASTRRFVKRPGKECTQEAA